MLAPWNLSLTLPSNCTRSGRCHLSPIGCSCQVGRDPLDYRGILHKPCQPQELYLGDPGSKNLSDQEYGPGEVQRNTNRLGRLLPADSQPAVVMNPDLGMPHVVAQTIALERLAVFRCLRRLGICAVWGGRVRRVQPVRRRVGRSRTACRRRRTEGAVVSMKSKSCGTSHLALQRTEVVPTSTEGSQASVRAMSLTPYPDPHRGLA